MPYSNDGEHYFVEVISDKYGDTLVIFICTYWRSTPHSLLIFSPFKARNPKTLS
jgi:hypothetical protein